MLTLSVSQETDPLGGDAKFTNIEKEQRRLTGLTNLFSSFCIIQNSTEDQDSGLLLLFANAAFYL
uniref:Molybdopterin cofactor synthesis protein A n=1 Tax=Solanum tuberosum TaxID=4113 RepID=M1CTU9_SOLTU